MKLEEGMYVRTDEGIAKVIEKRKNPYGEETIFIIDKPFMYHLTDFLRTAEDMIDVNFEEDTKQIKGASHNIIDLIEVGDYVNGKEVEDVINNTINLFEQPVLRIDDDYYLIAEDIKSIVTKEQFSQMEYKVGD